MAFFTAETEGRASARPYSDVTRCDGAAEAAPSGKRGGPPALTA